MTTLTLVLPDVLQEFVSRQVDEQGFTTAEEYVEKLVLEERKKTLRAYYEKEVGKAVESGPPIPADEFWKQIDTAIKQRRKKKKTAAV